jgi:hypothetical protein
MGQAANEAGSMPFFTQAFGAPGEVAVPASRKLGSADFGVTPQPEDAAVFGLRSGI